MDGYSVRVGVPPGARDQGFSFTLRTPERWYNLSAHTAPDRDQWIAAIEAVIERPITLQEKAGESYLHNTTYFIVNILFPFQIYHLNVRYLILYKTLLYNQHTQQLKLF